MLRINKYSNEHILLSEENCNVYIPLTESNKFLDTNIFTNSVGSSIVENNSKAVQNNHLASIEDLPEIISEEQGTHAHKRVEHHIESAKEWSNGPFYVSIINKDMRTGYAWLVDIRNANPVIGDYYDHIRVYANPSGSIGETYIDSRSNCVTYMDYSNPVVLGLDVSDFDSPYYVEYSFINIGGKLSEWSDWTIEYDEVWYIAQDDATCEVADCPYRLEYEKTHPELPDLPDQPTDPVTPSENTPSVSDNNGENHYGENQEISVSVNLDTEAIVSAIPSDSSNYRVVDIFLTSSIVGVLLGYILFRRIS